MEPPMPKRGAIKRLIFREMLGVISDLTQLREKVTDITNLIVRESALLRGSEDQFIETEKYLRELHSMLTVVEGVESHLMPTVAEGMGGSDQMPLVEGIQQLLVHAEDVVSAFVNERGRHSDWGCFRRTIFFFRDMIASHRFQDEIEKIRLRTERIKLQGNSIGIGPIDASEDTQSTTRLGPSGSHVKESNDIMGLELHYKVIKSRLMDTAGSGEKQSVISIVGSREAGKTTLAHKIYNDILDDVWMTEEWDELRMAFPKTNKGSGIIVTTRVRKVALHTNPKSPPYELQLSNDDGWILLNSKIDVPAELEEVGRAIVKATKEQWTLMLDQLKNDCTSVYKSLRDTTNFLPSYLMRCLYYFGLFPEDYDIPTRRLIILWVAKGLAQKDEGFDESPEVVAEKYLSMLIERNMIQVVERKPNGRVKTCRMHDVLRDEWVGKSKAANFLPAQNRAHVSSSSGGVTISRLADHLHRRDDSYSHIHGDNSSNSSLFRSHYKNVHTLLSFDSREGFAPKKEIGDFLRRGIINRCFQGMCVLDLERVFRPKLPESLGELIYLRYLGLRWTYLENLPSSIGKLFNLQILDLKHTYVTTLPRSFWKMQQLRHLYLSESYRMRFVPPRGTGSLTDLQTLGGAFVDEESTLDNSLYRLTKLRKLALTCRLTRDQQKATARWISSLKRLEWLRLISINISVKPSDLYLELLSGLENLSSIYLVGRLTNPVVVDKFPEKLTELTLSLSGLTEDPMPKLEKLPNLKILQLLSDAFVGKFMVCSPGGFPLLQELKLWKLKQLEGWVVGKGSLLILKELEIRACMALQKIPEGLEHLEFLHKLKLKDMPQEFTRRVRKGEGEDWGIIVHVHAVDITPSTDQQSQTSANI
ncbi:hypothetical protein ACJRO7_012989 [Eucalyptus globulus]|uniref:Uncharacterized protein n=1 Tax=Eucalyptus globulus TaxID=34317 RepID=A0ABD3LV77_EUCGL